MNPSRGPLARATFPNNDQLTSGYSSNIVNVPNQAHFQASGKPPPLPPIPQQLMSSFQQPNFMNNMGYSTMNRYSNYQGFGPSYNNFHGGYRGLNNHYPFNGFMGNYGNDMPFGANNPSSPFSSIELFVQTVSSLSMMLESTLNATYTSMQAIAGVMDNCNRLRRYLIDFVKLGFTIQFIRKIINFCKWVVCFIRGKTYDHEESLWNAAKVATDTVEGGADVVERGSVWPLAAFFSLLIGGPYLIKKLFNISTLHGDPTNSAAWDQNVDGKQECVAVYDFIPTQQGCLKLKAGEIIFIPKIIKYKDWCSAVNKRNEIGLVPLNRIRRIIRKPIVKTNNASEVTDKANLSQQKLSNNLTTSAPCTYSVDLKPLEEKNNANDNQESSK